MNVLTIAPTPFFADRGTHIRILEEARAHVRAGHTVTIATYHIGGAIPGDDAVSRAIRIRRIRRWLFWYKKLESGPDWQKIILDIMLLRKVFHIARTERPDVLHAHLHEGMLIAWIVQKVLWWRKMVIIADVHGSLVNEMTSHGYLSITPLRTIFCFIERIVNQMGDRIVASSWENQAYLQSMRAEKVEVLLDGVDLSAYAHVDRDVLRAQYGIPLDARVVLYAGALVSNKGMHILFEAIPHILAADARVIVVLAGFPVEQAAAWIATQPDPQRVRLISPLAYHILPHILALGDVAVDPKDSSVQQASGKILQYMGAGLPVVCFDKENNRRYLDDAGTYVKEQTGIAFAQAVQTLLADDVRRSACAQSVRMRAAQFSWDAGVSLFMHLVEDARASQKEKMAEKS